MNHSLKWPPEVMVSQRRPPAWVSLPAQSLFLAKACLHWFWICEWATALVLKGSEVQEGESFINSRVAESPLSTPLCRLGHSSAPSGHMSLESALVSLCLAGQPQSHLPLGSWSDRAPEGGRPCVGASVCQSMRADHSILGILWAGW